jgi:hypothetical protein
LSPSAPGKSVQAVLTNKVTKQNLPGMKPFSGFHEGMAKPPSIRKALSVWVAAMLTTTVVVKSYADGVHALESAPIDSR